MIGKYDDLLDHPRWEPREHARMAREARAAQFAPFAALVGYEDAVREREDAHALEQKDRVGEDGEAIIEWQLRTLSAALAARQEQRELEVTFFRRSENHPGGHPETLIGKPLALDAEARLLVLETQSGASHIPIEDILALGGPLFEEEDAPFSEGEP